MASELEDIYKSFEEATVLFDQAMDSMNNSIAQLRQAKRRVDSVFESLAEFMSQEMNADTMKDYGSATGLGGGSLFRRLTGGMDDFSDFFNIGGLF